MNDAVAAAAAAFKNVWADYDAVEREKLFWRWAEIIEKRADELGAVHGKEGGGASAADGYRWTATAGRLTTSAISPVMRPRIMAT